ncbi:MAG TPA: 3-hydroxyacyl-CoA dehydrogenase family protein [Terracidiphilus sp.]|nr:3-hydroxyacyl-CoA dehydrogenase family protein [Terracidiphilus sp.]
MGFQVGIVGAGLMGHGIAQVFAMGGHPVRITDADERVLSEVPQRISASLIELGIEKASVLARIRLTPSLAETVDSCAVVIEAVPEKIELKRALFQQIAEMAPQDALLATNTSSIPVTEIGRDLPGHARRRLVGLHWWNPPVLIPLVEVIRTEFVDSAFFDRAFELMRLVGKEPVRVEKDIPGFIGNRLMHAFWREAISLVDAGVCDADTIDLVVKRGFGLRLPVLGPMENADLVGLELTRDIQRVIFPSLERSSEPSPLLDRLIAEHKLGMRSGEGLRKWTPEQIEKTKRELSAHLFSVLRNGKQ